MMPQVSQIRVFISGPSDADPEKQIVKDVCDDLNQGLRDRCNVNLLWLEWRKSVVPQLGPRPQEVINDGIGEYEVFIGVLKKRFGTPPGAFNPRTGAEYESGTEEEFELAYEQWKQTGELYINFYFERNLSFTSPNPDEAKQLLNVVKFKERIRSEDKRWVVEFDGILNFYKEVRRFLESVCWEIHDDFGKTKRDSIEPLAIVSQRYEEVATYLHRTVASTEDLIGKGSSYRVYSKSEDALTIAMQQSRVALLGDAGSGKTTELQRIAAHFSKDNSNFFPFLVRLNKYVNQKIADFLPPYWTEIPSRKLLVLFDGLDEVESQNRNNAIRQIELFADQNPDSHIVVSCRSNFYKTETGQSSASLKDFHSYTLLNLSHSAITEYLTATLGNQKQAFERLIDDNKLWSLIEIPFYLVRIADEFLRDGGLPDSKAQLFERLIHDQITYDVEHFRTTINLDANVDVAIATLERVALSMEGLGRNYVSKEEYERIVPDEFRRKLINHYSGWKKTEGEKEQWQFEHNNLQEYLAAKVLARQGLQTIQTFISFAPEHKRLFPSWVNSLAFLVSILDANGQVFQDLIAWILESQPEVVVKFELDKIDASTRIDLFKKIFEYYKDRQIPIDRDKFDYGELARFGQSDDSVNFLIAEAANATDDRTLANAIQLLGDSDIPRSRRQTVTRLLVDITVSTQAEDYVRNRALMSLADLKLNSQGVINEIVPILRSSDNQWLRFGLYYLLYNSDHLDENIEIFFEGLQYVGIFSQRLWDEQWHLAKGLEKATSPRAVKKILAYLKQDVNEIDQYSFQTTIEAIAKNAANAYQEEPSVLDLALDLVIALHQERVQSDYQEFLSFFDLTNTELAAFQKVLVNRNNYSDSFSILALLATQECLEYFVQEYQERNITNEEVWTFQYHLGSAKSGLYMAFNHLINQRSGNKFVLPSPKAADSEKKEPRVNDIDLLFDREAFIREVRRIFEAGSKELLSKDDVFEITKNQWAKPIFSYLAIRILSQISAKQPVGFERVVEIINSWDWELFRASVLYERFSNDDSLSLPDDQKKIVASWCDENLGKVDFKKALLTQSEGRGSTSWLALYLWSLLRRLDLKYPNTVLLDMLSFDWIEGHQFLGIEYLEVRLSETEITERVLENLSDTIESENVLINHLRFCERHSIKEVVPYALVEIRNSARGEVVRTIALDIVSKLTNDISALETALTDIHDRFRWKVVDKLIERASGIVHGFLLNVLDTEDEEEQCTAAIYLTGQQDMRGLAFYVDWVKRHKQFPESDVTGSALRKLRTSESIPLLMELLQLGYEKGLVEDQFHTLDRAALDALNTVAMQSEDSYRQVREKVQGFIPTNISTLKNVNFLYQYLDSLERSFYLNRSAQVSLDEVIAKVNDVLN
jgi:predicted NACHT family NTPase